MQPRIYIHATNVHQGGGRALLAPLLEALPDSPEICALLDNRMQTPYGMRKSIRIKRVQPTVVGRLRAEQWLANNVKPGDLAICFGNLPPLFKLRGRTVVFLQNRYLTDDMCLKEFPPIIRARIVMERLWVSSRVANVDEFVVQTPTMKRLLETKIKSSVLIRILPFIADPSGYSRRTMLEGKLKKNGSEFLYVSSGEPHKNHLKILDAWRLLAEEGIFPSLRLTLDEVRFQSLCREIGQIRERYGLKVTNMGLLSHGDVLALYVKVDALIFPSNFESFGLPLIEARQAGLPILAAELDYVRDVLDPEQSFNPESPISIARAVKRFIGIDEVSLPLLDAKGFFEQIVGKAKIFTQKPL
jgi:glycosyltransferase involved in cell wall biosynthesis